MVIAMPRHTGFDRRLRRRPIGWLAVILVAPFLLAPFGPADAREAPREARLFEHPLSVKRIPPKSETDAGGEVICTYYPDLMIRKSGTDSPEPDAATIVTGAHPSCTAGQPGGGVALPTQGYSLVGRKGLFVVFSATDPNGAVTFMVLDARSGRVIYQDGTAATRGFHAVGLEAGALRLRYTRGLNASCSIANDPTGCWAKLVADGKIPPEMARAVPPAQRCAASYKALRAPPDDPSVIVYDVDMTIDAEGKTQVLSRGAVGCEPVP